MRKHVHKYEKAMIGKDKNYLVYRCALPDCNHYTPPELMPGKLSICHRCGGTFIITRSQIRVGKEMLKPHCDTCTKRKVRSKENEDKAAALFRNLGLSGKDD